MTGKHRYTHLSIGDTVTPDHRPAMLGADLDGIAWYIFRTVPQAELPAIAWLARNGIPDAWCPTETRYRKVTRGKRAKVQYEAPIAPGYLFVPFTREPIWHILFERAKGKLSRVVSINGVPLAVPERSIAQMKHVPERIAAIKAREEEARRLNPGDRADVQEGPLAGWTVDISRIHAGIAYFVAPLLGEREIAVPVAKLRKLRD